MEHNYNKDLYITLVKNVSRGNMRGTS